MRLAVVSPFVDRRHGTERALVELLERFAANPQVEIHVYAERLEDLAGAVRYTRSSQGKSAANIHWHRVPRLPGPHLFAFVWWFFANQIRRRWDRIIHGLRFDLVLSPGINCFDADVVIVHALFHRLRELVREEESQADSLLRRFHRRFYYSLLTWLERRVYSDLKVPLAAVSRRTASLLNRYFHRDDVRVIPNGVDANQFSPARRLARRAAARSRYNFLESDFVLLLIGNDWRNKGLSAILAAMAACPEIPMRLLVAGQDATSPFFFEAAERLRLSGHCRWETTLTDPIDLYAAADAYVSPTLEDAFALPPLEAMACGLPVITSVNNGGSQIITEGFDGFVVSDPHDSAALARLLRRLYQEPYLRQRIGENAARTAQGYTWERNASETWDFLMSALNKKQQRAGPF